MRDLKLAFLIIKGRIYDDALTLEDLSQRSLPWDDTNVVLHDLKLELGLATSALVLYKSQLRKTSRKDIKPCMYICTYMV